LDLLVQHSLTCFNTLQRTQSDATLGLVIHILLLQEIHIGNAQALGILVVALIRIPFVLLYIAVAWLIRIHARLVNGARAGASAEELVFGLDFIVFFFLGEVEKFGKKVKGIRKSSHTFAYIWVADLPAVWRARWVTDWATSAPHLLLFLAFQCAIYAEIFVGYQPIWGCISDKAIRELSISITEGFRREFI